MILFIQFFLAHILGDFFLQPGKWVKEKEQKKWRSGFLYLHVCIHFALIIIITRDYHIWPQALCIAALHLLIDGVKLQFQKPEHKRTWFFSDQALHLLSIFIVWYYKEDMVFDVKVLSDPRVLTYITAVLFLLRPTSFIIRTVVSRWSPGAVSATVSTDSLENAGQLIGIMERLLIFIFILLGKWEGVGFLLAAKSVFRFGDLKEAKDMKLTEYVLIGTFLSFGIAVLTGLTVLGILDAI